LWPCAGGELAFLAELLAVLRGALRDPGRPREGSRLACAHPTLRSRVGVAPHDDDERTGTVARPADNRGVARLRLDVGRDLGETSACEAHVELQRGPPDTLRRDF